LCVDHSETRKSEHTFRDLTSCDRDSDFQNPGASETAIESMQTGVERNTVHPSQLPSRILDHFDRDFDWKGASAIASKPLGLDTTVTVASHDIRSLDNFDRHHDFQRPGVSESAIENMQAGVEVNVLHPDMLATRDLARLTAAHDWKYTTSAQGQEAPLDTTHTDSSHDFRLSAKPGHNEDFQMPGKSETAIESLPRRDFSPYSGHPSQHIAREVSRLPHAHDFQIVGASETAASPLHPGVEVNAKNPDVHVHRELTALPLPSDFQRVSTSESAIESLPGGVSPNRIHPSKHSHRDLAHQPVHADFQIVSASETAIEEASFDTEASTANPDHHTFRDVEHLAAFADFQRVAVSETVIKPLAPGVEGNEVHSSRVSFRELQHRPHSDDFQKVGMSETALESLQAGVEKDGTHVSEATFRPLKRFDAEFDFQRVGTSETALESLPAGIEANPEHPDELEFRGLKHFEPEHDWKRAPRSSGLKPLGPDTEPVGSSAEFNFRDVRWQGGPHMDFQFPGKSESALEPLQAGIESNSVHPSKVQPRDYTRLSPEYDFSLATHNVAITDVKAKNWPGSNDTKSKSVRENNTVVAEKGWSISTKVPQGRARRVTSQASVRSGAPRKKKQKKEAWCMAMLDAQRGRAKTKKPTKK